MQPAEHALLNRRASSGSRRSAARKGGTSQWFVVDWGFCLGAGGESEVFLGRCVETWELCAIKVSTSIDPELAGRQLGQELDRLARVSGDGVVEVLAWNLDAARPFLVLELADAGSLADEIRDFVVKGRVYHPVRALERLRDVLEALAAVHDRGVVHRDVKPANLLRFGDRLKLADFGTGRSAERVGPSDTQSFVGTRLYAAPEQLAGESVDKRADLYSVGCILHEMLTGHPPEDPGRGDTARVYPSTLVLPTVDDLLGDLLSDRVHDRPPSAADAIRRVQVALREYGSARTVWSRLGLGPSPY